MAKFYSLNLTKPDGRSLHLYSRRPLNPEIKATNPPHEPILGISQLRYHPLRGEWVAFAGHRQNRTFLPPKEYSPLAVTKSLEFPTELPAGDYDVAVFANLFPSLSLNAVGETVPEFYTPSKPGIGTCEVVVFTQDPETSLGSLTLDHIDLVIRVWGERTRELAQNPHLNYVLLFENRGVEVGVTLHHPHGQIYAYPMVPPVAEKMIHHQREHFQKLGTSLIQDMLASEIRDQTRLVVQETTTTAFVPVCARYPYETWIVPQRPVAFLHELTDEERLDFAKALQKTLRKMDELWKKPFPYLLAVYQAPTDGSPTDGLQAHIQIYPALRTRDKLKFLAGTEMAAGLFVNDSYPEEKAAELRSVELSPEYL